MYLFVAQNYVSFVWRTEHAMKDVFGNSFRSPEHSEAQALSALTSALIVSETLSPVSVSGGQAAAQRHTRQKFWVRTPGLNAEVEMEHLF